MDLFAEVLNRAPRLILSNVNYVKKVVFPLEILPVITMGAALFHSLISLGVLLAAFALFNGYLHWTAVFTPLVLLPLVILTLGLAWMLASLGVFLRDVGQTIGIITTVMMFLSPVFYPITALPEEFRPWIMANPLTFIIEQAREVLDLGASAGLGWAWAFTPWSLPPSPGQATPGSRRPERGLPMSSDDIAISVTNLSKRYEIYDAPRDRLKQFVLPRLSAFDRASAKAIFPRILGAQGRFF